MANAVLARIKKDGEHFEIFVDCEKALDFKHGKISNVKEALMDDNIFSDSKKGIIPKVADLKKAFGTDNQEEVAKYIIKHGEIQLTAEYRQKVRDERHRQIVNVIHINAIDPKTGLPHPPQRIENALAQAKVKIDEHKTAEEQLDIIVKQINAILPIRIAKLNLKIRVPATYAGKAYGTIKKLGVMKKEEWKNDGSLEVVLEIPAGLQTDVYSSISNATHGSSEIETSEIKDF